MRIPIARVLVFIEDRLDNVLLVQLVHHMKRFHLPSPVIHDILSIHVLYFDELHRYAF